MILLLLLFLFISSFALFIASRHDFVLLRQNISIRLVFDRAFIIVIAALFISRIFYLLDQRMFDFFLDPLRFMHVILYYGFDIFGFVCTLSLGVAIFFRKRKNVLRVLDIYLLSFFPLVIFQNIVSFINSSFDPVVGGISIAAAAFAFILFIIMHNKFGVRDGVVSFLIIIFSALAYLFTSFYVKHEVALFSVVQIAALIAIAISIYCLVLVRLNFFKEK